MCSFFVLFLYSHPFEDKRHCCWSTRILSFFHSFFIPSFFPCRLCRIFFNGTRSSFYLVLFFSSSIVPTPKVFFEKLKEVCVFLASLFFEQPQTKRVCVSVCECVQLPHRCCLRELSFLGAAAKKRTNLF